MALTLTHKPLGKIIHSVPLKEVILDKVLHKLSLMKPLFLFVALYDYFDFCGGVHP